MPFYKDSDGMLRQIPYLPDNSPEERLKDAQIEATYAEIPGMGVKRLAKGGPVTGKYTKGTGAVNIGDWTAPMKSRGG